MAKLSETARKNKVDYNVKYNQLMTKRIVMNLNKSTMADVIEQLEKQESKQGYIIGLIRKDIGK